MAQITVSIRMDEELKKQVDAFCKEVGMSFSTAVALFAKTMVREKRIPFEITTQTDPFYGENNMKALRASIAQMDDSTSPKVVKTQAELKAIAEE